MPDRPGDGGDRPRDRPVAERVLRDHDRRRPADPARRRGAAPPFSRVAEDRDGGARLRVGERQRRRADARRRAGRRRRCAMSKRDDVGPAGSAACPGCWTIVSLLAGDDVRRGHDEVRARDPAAALDADPAGGAEDLDDAVRGGADRRVAERRPCSAAPTAAVGPAIDGNGSMRASRFSSVRGGSGVVEPARRSPSAAPPAAAASGPARAARPRRRPRRSRAPIARAEQEAADRVEQPQRRQPQPAADERAGDRARPSGAAPRRRTAPTSPASGVHVESAPPCSRCGATREPDVGAGREPGERERAQRRDPAATRRAPRAARSPSAIQSATVSVTRAA